MSHNTRKQQFPFQVVRDFALWLETHRRGYHDVVGPIDDPYTFFIDEDGVKVGLGAPETVHLWCMLVDPDGAEARFYDCRSGKPIADTTHEMKDFLLHARICD